MRVPNVDITSAGGDVILRGESAPASNSRRSEVSDNSHEALFSPVRLGPLTLQHRIVMAPMTRQRSQQPGNVPGELQREYYSQRATDGGLIISEGTAISSQGHGGYGSPGLWTGEHIAGWTRITDAVHAKGAHMFAQLWHGGRMAHVSSTGEAPVAPSVDPTFWADDGDPGNVVSTVDGLQRPTPHRQLATDEIEDIVGQFITAADNAKAAGFDGVELHGAYGYLIDEFLQDGTNKRTDRYGGSKENRTRMLVEVLAGVIGVWGPGRVAVRLAPGGTFHGVCDSDPDTLFGYVGGRLNELDLAYLHIIESRVRGFEVIDTRRDALTARHLRDHYRGTLIATGGFEPDTATEAVACGDADLIGFARHFISNPDLPDRIVHDYPLSPSDPDTYYTFGARGYTDYPSYTNSTV
jgi:N-ethylmaleimide reductase